MNKKNEFYLVVISILLASSLLKTTEIFQLGGQVKDVVAKGPEHMNISTIGVYVFFATFLLFFAFSAMTICGLVKQISCENAKSNDKDLGFLVNTCVILLTTSHTIAFMFIINTL